jgi:glycine hydroxymethyltransferase
METDVAELTELHGAVAAADPALAALLARERARQFYTAKLIPSENYASAAVLAASASVLTNKYAEGYPRKRYYEGQQIVDQVEELAIGRARALFGAEHANVQPYSGSPANLAAYTALIGKKAENRRILGLALSEGGHLTHGHSVSVTSRFFEAHHYSVDRDTHLLDYDAIAARAREVRPAVLVAGATCYPRQIDFARMAAIAAEVGARLLCDIAHIAGLVAGGAHPSPLPHADVVSSTTHKTLRGPRGGLLLCRAEHARAIDRAVFPGLQGGPHVHAIAALAVALAEASRPEFARYAQQVVANARALADELLRQGVRVVTGGTDNHLVLIDVTAFGGEGRGPTGKEAATALDLAGLETNANTIPFDPRPPMDPSGVRLGTPALTSRGLGEAETRQVARWIARVLGARGDAATLAAVRAEVRALLAAFPPPGIPEAPDVGLVDEAG